MVQVESQNHDGVALLKVEENPPSTREKKNKHICRYTLVVETIRQPDRGAMGLEERMSQE